MPDKGAKQYGLELLKQQLRYDDEMEDQHTNSHIASQKEMDYKQMKRPESNVDQYRSQEGVK
jgi:hypothetical protein